MAEIQVTGTNLGSELQSLLVANQILPGDAPSYQLAKVIYEYHPLGAKMAEAPVANAMSQERLISIPKSPEARVREQFLLTWAALGIDNFIYSCATQSRVYGVTAMIYGMRDMPADKPIDYWLLGKSPDRLYFNVVDPLNTSGSLVLNQDPNSPDFQKPGAVSVAGKYYHMSRSVVLMNEQPLFLAYSQTAFGYVGRSVYQRALFPLKSFISTMITDDMVSRKVGLLVAMMEQAGSISDNVMAWVSGIKRNILKMGETEGVLSIGENDKVESLDMTNIDGAGAFARTNILKNIATAASMPAKMLENETMVSGFGEGTEDAKNNARYIDGIRKWMRPLYAFLDPIVMHVAWNEEFFEIIKKEFPADYADKDYKTAFYQWKNSFAAKWPSLLIEPDSELVKVEDIKQKAIIALLGSLLPILDPDNKAALITACLDNLNENKLMFPNPFILDMEAFINYKPPMMGDNGGPPMDDDEPDAPRPESPES